MFLLYLIIYYLCLSFVAIFRYFLKYNISFLFIYFNSDYVQSNAVRNTLTDIMKYYQLHYIWLSNFHSLS